LASINTFNMADTGSVTVLITGAAGRIAYSLIPLVADGSLFGPTVRISLRLLDIEFSASRLAGVKMEIDDSNYPLLDSVIATTNPEEAFRGVNVAVFLGELDRCSPHAT
jgi:lactate/malate dehydrogenase, NAD binding domain